MSNFLKVLKESTQSLKEESRSFPEIEKFDSLGRVLTVGEHKKLTQAVLKAVHEVTGGTAIYDQYEKAFEDLKSKYPVLRSFGSKQIDDLWEAFMSLDESKVQTEEVDQTDFLGSLKKELKKAQAEVHAARDRVSRMKKPAYSDAGGNVASDEMKMVSSFLGDIGAACGMLADEEYAASVNALENAIETVEKHADLDVEAVESSVQTEDIDTEEIQGDKQKEIIQVMATAIAVGLAQVENILGENFENASQAEKFYWALTRAMRTGSAAGDLKSSLRRFDRIGGERVLSTFRRDLAHV